MDETNPKIMNHQFQLFGFQPPKKKIKITAEAVKEAKRMYEAKDFHGSADKLREVREALERKYGV